MVGIFRQPLTADDVKHKARELGADLVGIADGELMNRHPPDPADPRRPIDITELDYRRVIVLAKRLNSGVARILPWGDRTKFYNDELSISTLEEISLELVYWLEELGYPAIIVPPLLWLGSPDSDGTTCGPSASGGRPGPRRSAPASACWTNGARRRPSCLRAEP